jgi:hypothetical protein
MAQFSPRDNSALRNMDRGINPTTPSLMLSSRMPFKEPPRVNFLDEMLDISRVGRPALSSRNRHPDGDRLFKKIRKNWQATPKSKGGKKIYER